MGELKAKEFIYSLTILESHLDTFGHVNNATYLALYEEARWDFITQNGYGLDRIKQTGVGPIILEANIRFKAELLNREKINIRSQLIEIINPKVYHLRQEMLHSSGKIASDLHLKFGVFDLKKRKLIRPGLEWEKILGIS